MGNNVPGTFRAVDFGGGSGRSFTQSKSDQLARDRMEEDLRRYEISQARLQKHDVISAEQRVIDRTYAKSRDEEARARAAREVLSGTHQTSVRADYEEDRARQIAIREAGDIGLSMDPADGMFTEKITGTRPAEDYEVTARAKLIGEEYDINAFAAASPEIQKQMSSIDEIDKKKQEFIQGKDYVRPGFGSGKSDEKIAEFDAEMAVKAETVDKMIGKNLEDVIVGGVIERSKDVQRQRRMPLTDYKKAIIDQFKEENPGADHKLFMRSDTYKDMVSEQSTFLKEQKKNDAMIRASVEAGKASVREAEAKRGIEVAKGVTAAEKLKIKTKATKEKERKDRVLKIMKDLDIDMKKAQSIESGL